MKRLDQRGSHVVAVVALVLVLSVAGFAGYRVMQGRDQAATSTAKTKSAIPAKITSDADLNQTNTALDATATEVDSSLDDSTLDADLNSML